MRNILFTAALVMAPASAFAETVVVTADRVVDVLAGRVVERPVIANMARK